MKYSLAILNAGLATLALAAPADQNEKRAIPTIWLAGDSTMTKASSNSATQGWGVYLPYSIKGANVVNKAIGGRSSRSYTVEGRFDSLAQSVLSGDIVIIEFGHNDGGSLSTTDNGRSVCGGSGSETCTTAAGLVVQTYPTYLTNAAKLMTAKGAKVIISSPTPNNVCETGTCSYTPSRFTDYCKIVVKNVGNSASFIDHGQYVANRYIALGVTKTNAFYPVDHTHTSPAGADSVAGQFVKAALCANSILVPYIKNSTASVAGSCV
ncbi:carbohydrate esterase family 12 protein [Amylocarpus encephaloides]|uniref:Carbohydrate esterase family 12 protein n=1 Tax=Amylocarpus encephaloides TaxID=45428 RepID=A0A9P8C878_9HELO|nr:carbohydrate esterase family 12 protein [Amylocarpus encephaloides]